VSLPHDFVVEGNFTPDASRSQGYLPFGRAWYRRHLAVPAVLEGATMWLDFEGVQTTSTVFLNGEYLGTWPFGYTSSRYFLPAGLLHFGADNVLAVFVDCTSPDGWWYDGGGIYRHVWLTAVSTVGPYLGPLGVYAPTAVVGAVTWTGGAPFADAALSPSVEVWSNASSGAAPVPFTVQLAVYAADGTLVTTASGDGAAPGGGAVTDWAPGAPLGIPRAALWHLVSPPLTPALYALRVTLLVGGAPVDAVNVTFGIRDTAWSNATGFWLNGVATKIFGNANHQVCGCV
jgi:beta-galactosidase